MLKTPKLVFKAPIFVCKTSKFGHVGTTFLVFRAPKLVFEAPKLVFEAPKIGAKCFMKLTPGRSPGISRGSTDPWLGNIALGFTLGFTW